MLRFLSFFLLVICSLASAECPKIYTMSDIVPSVFYNNSPLDTNGEYLKFLGAMQYNNKKSLVPQQIDLICDGKTKNIPYMMYSCMRQEGVDNGYQFINLFIKHDVVTNNEPNTFYIYNMRMGSNYFYPLYGASSYTKLKSSIPVFIYNCSSTIVDTYNGHIYTISVIE